MNDYDKIIEKIKNDNDDMCNRTIYYESNQITLLYIKELTDRSSLSKFIIQPLIETDYKKVLNAKNTINDIIYIDDCKIDNDKSIIEKYILSGFTIILFSNDDSYIILNTKKVQHRPVSEPELNYTLRGPKDCFVEHLITNISLVRYRLKSNDLRISYEKVGVRTEAKVAILYFEDIANNSIVEKVKEKINQVNVDGIIESGELQSFMLNNKYNLFPEMGIIERSDMACGALLEGKVVILVEGSCLALVAPKTLPEFLWSCNDMYDNKYVGFFLKLLSVFALVLSFTASPIYIALVSFQSDIMPSNYIVLIAETRAQVPFSAFIEVMLIEIIIELLREALIRVPSKVGAAIGIVGAIIIGQAAISAGVFSPLLLIVISVSMISSFVPSDYTIVNPFRIVKFLLIMITAVFGFYGLILGLTLLLAHLVSVNSFGVPYLAPFTPFNIADAYKSFCYSKSLAKKRPQYLQPKNKYRWR